MLERLKAVEAKLPTLESLLVAAMLVLDGYYPKIADWLVLEPNSLQRG